MRKLVYQTDAGRRSTQRALRPDGPELGAHGLQPGFANAVGVYDTETVIREQKTPDKHWIDIKDTDKTPNLELYLRGDESAPSTIFMEVRNPSKEGDDAAILVPFCELPAPGYISTSAIPFAKGVSEVGMIREADYSQLGWRMGALCFDKTGFTPDDHFFNDPYTQKFLARALGQAPGPDHT